MTEPRSDPQHPNFSFVKPPTDGDGGAPAPLPEGAGAGQGPKEQAFFDGEGHLVETDPSGVPRIPGTDDRIERHPFDPDDPDHEEIPPATVENLCCLAGPCKFYREVILEEPTEGDDQWAVLRRICKQYQDHESDWDLSEETMFACSALAPPWWSLRGQLRKLISWTELGMARRQLSPDWWFWHLPECAAAWALSKTLGVVGLYPDRKNVEVARSEPVDDDIMED